MAWENVSAAGAFRQRSWLPLPLILVLVLVHRWQIQTPLVWIAAALFVAAGLGLRLWSVRHIGSISRTRAKRFGPLLTSGPYAIVRNPLYVANWCLWTGFVFLSGLLWMLPIAMGGLRRRVPERSCTGKNGPCSVSTVSVPRVRERGAEMGAGAAAGADPRRAYPWSAVLFSERGTLLAASAIATVIALKRWFAVDW